jgi:hypothetical protein
LSRRIRLPVRNDSFREEGRKFTLELVREAKVDSMLAAAPSVAQNRHGFTRIVIAVMTEKYDFPAKLRLEPTRGLNF